MVIKDGRFGPYVTDGETNASLRKGDEVETITDERAAELLQDRRDRGPAKKRALEEEGRGQEEGRRPRRRRREEEGHGQEGGGEEGRRRPIGRARPPTADLPGRRKSVVARPAVPGKVLVGALTWSALAVLTT